MLDFTSVLYLGFRHSAWSLRPWSQLTTGVPAALAEPAGVEVLSGRLARLQGCEQAVLGPSTLHLFWDLFAMLAEQQVSIYLDADAYPIAGWGVERAAARGIPVRRFPHQDVDALARMVSRGKGHLRPVIVSDGLCTGCGCTAPVAGYLEITRQNDGLLVLDDTQALGLLGRAPNPEMPYGHAGGGTLAHKAIFGSDLILVSSLAKAFGAPLAALSGSREMVRRFRSSSRTRVHCSPPSLAALRAGERALALNVTHGDSRRRSLAKRVRQFRSLLAGAGLMTNGKLFPIQTLRLPAEIDAGRFHFWLLGQGIRTILRNGCDNRPVVSLAITATHQPQIIRQVVEIILAIYPTRRRLPVGGFS